MAGKNVRHHGICRIGEQLAGDDGELVAGHQPATNVCGCQLTDEDRHGCRGADHREPEDESEDDHHRCRGSQRCAQRADDEEQRQHQQGAFASIAVGQIAREHTAEGGTQHQ